MAAGSFFDLSLILRECEVHRCGERRKVVKMIWAQEHWRFRVQLLEHRFVYSTDKQIYTETRWPMVSEWSVTKQWDGSCHSISGRWSERVSVLTWPSEGEVACPFSVGEPYMGTYPPPRPRWPVAQVNSKVALEVERRTAMQTPMILAFSSEFGRVRRQRALCPGSMPRRPQAMERVTRRTPSKLTIQFQTPPVLL